MSFFKKQEEIPDIFDAFDGQPHEKKTSPNALTPEEILANEDKTPPPISSNTALDDLKKRIAEVARSAEPIKSGADESTSDAKPYKTSKGSDIESLKKQIESLTGENCQAAETEVPQKESLFDKCRPFITEDDGSEAKLDEKPIYKLQSVAEILKEESLKTLDKLSAHYSISVEDFTKSEQTNEPVKESQPSEYTEEKNEQADESEQVLTSIQSNVDHIISDIDSVESVQSDNNSKYDTSTITFTPVSNAFSGTSEISVSTKTQSIDLTSELAKLPQDYSEADQSHELQKDEFEEYIPKSEITTDKEAALLKRKTAKKVRNSFLRMSYSGLMTLCISVLRLPFVAGYTVTNSVLALIITAGFTLLAIVFNADMFSSLKTVFSKRSSADVGCALATLSCTALTVFGIVTEQSVFDIVLLLNFILLARAVGRFLKLSYLLNCLKCVYNPRSKKAVKFINDPAVTFSMAKNSIEGDVLAAVTLEFSKTESFMKHLTYKTDFERKYSIVTAVSLILSVISAVGCYAYFETPFYALYSFSAILSITSAPVAFLIDVLPLYRSGKLLSKYGACVLGNIGAANLSDANAVVIDANDIFPSGTVVLKEMKVLSENNLDDTLIRAAALAEYTKSPLCPIFKEIAKTGNIDTLPDTDTVKYEDRMGISGWVDNRLLFIGNRALMEAHSISVPSLEVDRRILRQGYFPVYVATREKVCALLIVEYNVSPTVHKELRRLTGMGVTLLVSSSDQNLTEEMICDYIGLYPDSVKIMSTAGCHMYRNAIVNSSSDMTPAVYRGGSIGLAAILNSANMIKKSNLALNIFYYFAAVIGAVAFAYVSFSGSGTLFAQTSLLIYTLISTAVGYLIYTFTRP